VRRDPGPERYPGTRDAYRTIQAESANRLNGLTVEITTDTGGGQNLGSAANGDWARYDGVTFGRGTAGLAHERADRQLRDREHRRLAELEDGTSGHRRGDRYAHRVHHVHQRH
jgi:carbohydrate binding protein with CBM6 domain